MPQGKGTYGSQVGRPPKKKYQAGGKVEPNFPQENPAIEEANKMGQELKAIPLESVEPELPSSDAMNRKEIGDSSDFYNIGGIVKPIYKKGGKV